jgi:hypothetical protein
VSLEREIHDLQRHQHGAATNRQLAELGLSRKGIRYRVADEQLVRSRRGVLINPAVPTSYEQSALVAVLAAGRGAFASHETAARLWALPLPVAALIEVTTDLKRRPRLKGVKMHRSGLLLPEDVELVKGIPCSTVDRTIVDLSGRYDLKTLGRIVDEALRRKLTTIAQLEETSARLKSAPGRSRKKMRTIMLRRDDGVAERESVLEDFVFEALRRFKLPLPVAQHPVIVDGKRRRIDFCYVGLDIALEPKGFEVHGLRSSFDADPLRGNELRLAGYFVLDFTSAFTDWQIADQVARALKLSPPQRPKRPLTFLEWLDRRDRLEA